MPITPTYAAVLAMLFLALSINTIRARRRLKIAVGDAGDKAMLRAMRVHANFAEYVPLVMLLLYFCEGRGAQPIFLHATCSAFVVARCVHAYGLNQPKENFKFRIFGTVVTFTCLVLASGFLILGPLIQR